MLYVCSHGCTALVQVDDFGDHVEEAELDDDMMDRVGGLMFYEGRKMTDRRGPG